MPTPTIDAVSLSAQTREAIDTPAVVVDLDRLDAAVGRMAAVMADRGVDLRPHAKTHKSIEVGRRQLAAGAAGLTVGTIGEAEVFADAGLDDLFIAYPLVPRGPKAARLRALARRSRLRVGVDSAGGVRAVADALGPDRDAVELLIEIDSGGRRSGVAPSGAGEIARIASDLGLAVIGVFTHGGHGYAGPDARVDAADDEVRSLTAAAGFLQFGGRGGAGRERGVDPDGRRLGARRHHRGATRDVRVRRPAAGRPVARSSRMPSRPSSPPGWSA